MKNDLKVLLSKEHNSMVIRVAQELAAHPDLSSEEIAGKLRISKEELVSGYETIQSSPELRWLVIDKSRYPRLTRAASELITGYSDYLTKILSGEKFYPIILEFHPGPVCQCQCQFCFSLGYDYDGYYSSLKPISPERVAAIFKECRENGVEEVWFSGGKEPFVNPFTPEYIHLASSTGFRTRLYTNGIALTTEAQKAALECYQIRISVNGAIAETYHRVQFPGYNFSTDGFFGRLLDNISGLVRLKKELGKETRIGLSQILQPDNYNEMIKFVELARQLGVDSVHFRLEAMGMVRGFTLPEKETIKRQIAEIKARENGIEVDIRGVEEGEFDSRESQFLPGLRKPAYCRAGLLKRGLNPYGALYNCEFSSHPRFRTESAHLLLGDATRDSLGSILRRRMRYYPEPCPLCQAHEYGLNITLERLDLDLKWGIPVEKQPYYVKEGNRKQSSL